MNQPTVSLTDVSTYLPGEPVGADYYAQFAGSDDLAANLMFRAPKFRHHVGPDETAIDMIERAAQGLIERHGQDVIANVDVLITHTQVPDMAFYGEGGGIAHRLGMRPSWVLDLNNGGCAAFVLALKVARQLLASGQGRTALIAVAQNAAGQVFDQAGSSPQGAVRSARRRRGGRPGHFVATSHPFSISSAAPTANTPARWCWPRTRPASGGQPGPVSSPSGSPKPRSPRCSLAEISKSPKWRLPSAIESACRPRTSTCWSPISPTGCSCETGATRSRCPKRDTSNF